ncbi:MAG: hypothetical protein SWK76_12530 [Actinomycetota bacterium]|nr:hypothetical protein [Actinomycetota bacterium]
MAVVGYSLGESSIMNTAYQSRDHPFLTGGAVAWNGYVSMKRMVEYISRRPPLNDFFFPVYLAFSIMNEMRRQDMKGYMEDPASLPYLQERPFYTDFRRYMDEVVVPHYSMEPDEIYRLSSPAEFISAVKIPLLVVHAEDDPICPIEEMDELWRAAGESSNVDILVLPTADPIALSMGSTGAGTDRFCAASWITGRNVRARWSRPRECRVNTRRE